MSELNPEIQRILDEHNIDPAPKKHALDDKFNSPMDQLDDLFKTFGRIFAPKPFEEDRQRNYREAKDQEDAENQDPCI